MSFWSPDRSDLILTDSRDAFRRTADLFERRDLLRDEAFVTDTNTTGRITFSSERRKRRLFDEGRETCRKGSVDSHFAYRLRSKYRKLIRPEPAGAISELVQIMSYESVMSRIFYMIEHHAVGVWEQTVLKLVRDGAHCAGTQCARSK